MASPNVSATTPSHAPRATIRLRPQSLLAASWSAPVGPIARSLPRADAAPSGKRGVGSIYAFSLGVLRPGPTRGRHQHPKDLPAPFRDRYEEHDKAVSPVSRLSAAIQPVALRRTTAPCLARSLSRADAVPSEAMQGLAN